ncbi:hypothetical protein [Faecalispora anaeroviscerum]|uniref:hypothetical protein n=1 Tax=Faecalispora anaeroviscerum TaxID=2991836 RepID=UPI0024BADDC7|nr:hypothetical protein [Faecalispora anaeroviscerum]
MMNKDDRKSLKEQEKIYKQKARERHEELKQLNAEQKKAAKQRRKEKKLEKKPAKPKSIKIKRMLLDVFPIRDSQYDYFLSENYQIIDIFQIRGKSYYNASVAEIEAMVDRLAYFFRRYKNDLKLIGMNYPTNTQNQQAFLTYKLQQPELQKYEAMLNEKIAILQYLEKNTTDREAFIMIFAKNENHYNELCDLLARSELYVDQISQEKKENIIFQLNNMNKKVKI